MAFINMDAINFYEQPPPKAGPRGEKRPPASNGNVSAPSEQCDSDPALQPGNQWSGRLQDCDLIEVLDMATPPPNKPLDLFGKLGADVEATGAGAGDMVKELGINRGRRRIGSDICQDLPSLEEMLFGAKEMQEPQRAGESGNLTGSSDDSLDLAVENNWKGSSSPKSRWDKSKGEPRLCHDKVSETCDDQDAERQCGDAQQTPREHADIKDTKREASTGSSVHTNDGLPCEEQDCEQSGERSSLSISPTSMADSEAGSFTLGRKNEFSMSHTAPPRRNSCLPSTACTQIHESTVEGRHNSGNNPSSEDKRVSWENKAAEAGDEGELQGDGNQKSTSLPFTKKRRRSAAGKKLPLKRVKRRRFSSPLSSSEETETGAESDISSDAPANLCRTSNLSPASSPLSTGREREPNPDDALEGANERSKRRSLSRTAVVYKQQCWEGEILQERDIKQERGRPRKQYLVRWKESWVDGARLTAPELLQNWREKKSAVET